MSESRAIRYRGASRQLVDAARELRRTQTSAEQRLWAFLRAGQLASQRVRRQHALGPFVVDFYFPAIRLAIELDGAVHDQMDVIAQDVARAEWIAAHQIRMLRFRNEEVMDSIGTVLDAIEKVAREST